MIKLGFSEDLEFGKQGEDDIYNYLMNHENSLNVIDVSNDLFFQGMDIDYIWQTKDENVYKIEVKTDRLADKTGNIIYEYYSSKKYGTKGCFEITKADYILYYIINAKELYCLNVEKLREYVYDKKDKLQMKCMGDDTLGYIIPIRLIEKYELGVKRKLKES